MALFRPSSIVGSISGAIGGVTFATGKRAPVVRHRPRFSPRQSESLLSNRVIFANATRAWSALSTADRTTWRALAANLPRTNRLGQQSPLTGFSVFVQRFILSELWQSPAAFGFPTIEGGVVAGDLSLAASAPSTIDATFDFVDSKNQWIFRVEGFRAFSATLPKFLKPWRVVATDNMAPLETPTLDISAGWNTVYGPLTTSEAVAIRVGLWDPFTMLLPRPWVQASAIVA